MKKIRVCSRTLLAACKVGDVDKVLYILSGYQISDLIFLLLLLHFESSSRLNGVG